MRYLLYFACVAFAACGGTGGGGNESGGAGTPAVSSNCSGGPPISGSYKLSVRSVDEVEPNDDVSTAFAVNMPIPAAAEDLVGIVIEGGVHDTMDRSDLYSFTSSRTRWFFFKLCESSCNTDSENDRHGNPDSLLVWTAHFSVLDADGRTIISTAGDNPIENYGEVCVDAGVITYIAVHANDTKNLVQPYRMSAFEIGR
jgi:hypothetical protein